MKQILSDFFIFLVLISMGFTLGWILSDERMEKEAVSAGVGKYTWISSNDATATFQWITPTNMPPPNL